MTRTARVIDPAEASRKDAAGSGSGAGGASDGGKPVAGRSVDGGAAAGKGGRPGFVLVMNDDVPSAKAASSRRFWGVRERAYRVSDPKGLSPRPGDTVELDLPQGRTVLSASLTFLLPLALFPLGYALTGRLLPAAGRAAAETAALGGFAGSEGMAFLIGFGFLLAGFPLGALIRRILKSADAVPEITRILTPLEAAKCSAKDAAGCGSCTRCG
jgi:positive regulator of sigma E activity